MREGFWIHAKTGSYRLVDDHARWMQRPENARGFGLAEDVVQALGDLHWDFNGKGRRDILLLAMDQGGLIRTRGHGPGAVTFEATLTIEETIKGSAKFMHLNCGPATRCTVSDLRRGETIVFTYGEAKPVIEAGDYWFLLPVWMRPTQALPVRRPYVLLNNFDRMPGWTCCELPAGLNTRGLVTLLRRHATPCDGWMALADGRTWKLSPNSPPLTPLLELNPELADRACPDCGWPSGSKAAPCQCQNMTICRGCGLPIFWPIPGRDFLTLQGEHLHAPTFCAYAHKCIHWPSVAVLSFDDLIRRGR